MNTLKTKIALYKTILALTAGASIGGAAGFSDYNNKVETIAEVPSVLRYELYNKNIIDHDLLGEYDPNSNRVDKLITYELLETVKYLSIDLALINDISYINKCPNVDTISVMHAERLNENQINILNNSSCNRIILYYDDIELHKENKLDLSVFNNKEEVLIHFYPTDELQAFTFMNYIQNKDLSNITIDLIGPFGDQYLLSLIDERLDQIVASLEIKENDDDYTKLLKIVNYINNKIEYDDRISGYLAGNKTVDSDRFTKLTTYYNDYDLSSVIFGDELNLPGVCVNYANLFDALAYKCGLKCRSVSGTKKLVSHAWDLLYLDDEKYYIDLTFSDMEYVNNKINEYLKSNSDITKEDIRKQIDNLVLLPLDTHEGYRITRNINYLDTNPEIIEVNYNVGLDGNKTMNKDFDLKYYIILGAITATIVFGGASLTFYLDRKRREREKFDLEAYRKSVQDYVERNNIDKPKAKIINLKDYDYKRRH